MTGVLLLAFLLRMVGTSSLLGDTKPDGKQMSQHENILVTAWTTECTLKPDFLCAGIMVCSKCLGLCIYLEKVQVSAQSLVFGYKLGKLFIPTSLSHSSSNRELGGVIKSSFAFSFPLFLLLLQDLHPISQRHLWFYICRRLLKRESEKQHESVKLFHSEIPLVLQRLRSQTCSNCDL